MTTNKTTFILAFPLISRVHIDGDREMTATIVGVTWCGTGVQYEVSWFHNGDLKSAWIDEARLTAKSADR